MRRLAVLVAAATLVLAVASADAASPGFRYGVAAGEITSTSAVLWTKAPSPGRILLSVAERDGPGGERLFWLRAERGRDLAVQVGVRKLEPATAYVYSFAQGRLTSARGSFTTASPVTSGESVRFSISGDADATAGSNGRPAFNNFGVYARMASEGNDFNINLGDTIYSDSEVGGAPVARTAAEKWGKYRLGLRLDGLGVLRRSAGLYSHWDDHEFINDFSSDSSGTVRLIRPHFSRVGAS